MMARLAVGLLWAIAAQVNVAQAGDGLEVTMQPLHFGGLQEFGMIRTGLATSPKVQIMKDEWVDHFGAYFVQEATVGGRLTVKGGLGGIFQFPKNETSQEGFGGSQFKMFFIGPSVAEAMYHFGGVEEGKFSLGGGMFPFKYNPDANDLGDYLLRGTPYPTTLITGGNGGLTAIGDQNTVQQGFRANFHTGGLNVDALLTTETGLPPLYDWTLACIGSYKVADGLLDLGAGVSFKRFLQINSGKSTVDTLQNSYFKKNGTWYSGQASLYKNHADFIAKQSRDALERNTHADSVLAQDLIAQSIPLYQIVDSLHVKIEDDPTDKDGNWIQPGTGRVAGASYYSPSGVMIMGRAALDLKKILPSNNFTTEDLRIYTEIAVLGVKSYPVFYENMMERMPIMVGMNIPTFKFLDLLSVQMEYFNSPNLNNTFNVGQNNWAIPYQPDNNAYSQKEYNDLTKKDNYSWSILARRKILSGVTLNGQIARDHLRTIGTDWFYGSRFEPNEVLHKTSSWYWMFQLAWNI